VPSEIGLAHYAGFQTCRRAVHALAEEELEAQESKENGCAKLMQNFSPLQQISIALAILAVLFYFALQIPWVAALFG
jgi:hypothetical protein